MVVLGNGLAAARMNGGDNPDAIHVDEGDHYNDEWAPAFDFRDTVRIRTNEKFGDYYEIFEEIGEGKFGKVFRCVEKSTGLELAAKCIRLRKDADLEKVEKEVNIMTKMRHRCIAQIYDAFATSSSEIVLIMELVSGGELFDRVVDESYVLTETAVAMIVYQICEAIKYIHSQNIIHLDLKPENVVCRSLTSNQVKLIDFGLAQHYDGQHDLLFMAGTPEFSAPEVIKYEPLDFHTDMWSLGVIVYILLSGQSPFLGDNIALTYCNVEKGKWEFSEEFDENGISEDARDFISKLLIVEKSKRMLPHECLEHPWIVKNRERARSSNRETIGKQLDVGKLRSYVRNKRFRRLVFGVLPRKSEGGIEYVKNMLNAVDQTAGEGTATTNAAASLVKSAFFAKRRRNATGDETTEAKSAGDAAALLAPAASTSAAGGHANTVIGEAASNSSSLHGRQRTPPEAEAVEQNPFPLATGGLSSDGGSSADESRPASPKPAKRIREKGDKPKRPKSSSRKASSSEQAAKKAKPGSGSLSTTPKPAVSPQPTPVVPEIVVAAAPQTTAASAPKVTKKKSTTEEKPQPAAPSNKLGNILSKFENDAGGSPFTLPVAGAAPLRRRSDDEKSAHDSPSARRLAHQDARQAADVPKPEEKKEGEKKKLKLRKLKPGTAKSKSAFGHGVGGREATRKSTETAAPTSRVSSLLPSFHRPKVEQAVERPSKVVRIESDGPAEAPQKTSTSSEKKTSVKKRDVRTAKSKGTAEANAGVEHEEHRAQRSTCEVSVKQRMTTVDSTATKVEDARARFEHAIEANERDKTRLSKVALEQQRSASRTVESEATLDLRQSKTDGKKLRKKQSARVTDGQTTTATVEISSTTTDKQTSINGGALELQRRRLRKVSTATDDAKETSVVQTHQKMQRTLGDRKTSEGSGVNENLKQPKLRKKGGRERELGRPPEGRQEGRVLDRRPQSRRSPARGRVEGVGQTNPLGQRTPLGEPTAATAHRRRQQRRGRRLCRSDSRPCTPLAAVRRGRRLADPRAAGRLRLPRSSLQAGEPPDRPAGLRCGQRVRGELPNEDADDGRNPIQAGGHGQHQARRWTSGRRWTVRWCRNNPPDSCILRELLCFLYWLVSRPLLRSVHCSFLLSCVFMSVLFTYQLLISSSHPLNPVISSVYIGII
ncbi:Stretchin-Mlck [Aphelenchoides fujianensis]|nr:Stretchin-Mlck [Aphelenchoides fujianensis]